MIMSGEKGSCVEGEREKSFLNLIIVWEIQIKLLFEAYLDVEIAHKHFA